MENEMSVDVVECRIVLEDDSDEMAILLRRGITEDRQVMYDLMC